MDILNYYKLIYMQKNTLNLLAVTVSFFIQINMSLLKLISNYYGFMLIFFDYLNSNFVNMQTHYPQLN